LKSESVTQNMMSRWDSDAEKMLLPYTAFITREHYWWNFQWPLLLAKNTWHSFPEKHIVQNNE
jgi:hypothetical protein